MKKEWRKHITPLAKTELVCPRISRCGIMDMMDMDSYQGSFAYNALSLQTSMTDAKGNYIIDVLGD